MKNIKKQLVNYRNAMVMHAWKVKTSLRKPPVRDMWTLPSRS